MRKAKWDRLGLEFRNTFRSRIVTLAFVIDSARTVVLVDRLYAIAILVCVANWGLGKTSIRNIVVHHHHLLRRAGFHSNALSFNLWLFSLNGFSSGNLDGMCRNCWWAFRHLEIVVNIAKVWNEFFFGVSSLQLKFPFPLRWHLIYSYCRRLILSGLLCLFSFRASGPFVTSFEFGPRTLSIFVFIEFLSRFVLVIYFVFIFVSNHYVSLNVMMCRFVLCHCFSYLFMSNVILLFRN